MASIGVLPRLALALGVALASLSAPPARAADTILIGSVDATSANLWPLYVAQSKGYFDAADLKLDVVFSPSNASVIQQLAAGSYNIAPSAGIVDRSALSRRARRCPSSAS
jgi:ABC-type nitrate/sulfonate/bicarbonate transport system substrate-binding protein